MGSMGMKGSISFGHFTLTDQFMSVVVLGLFFLRSDGTLLTVITRSEISSATGKYEVFSFEEEETKDVKNADMMALKNHYFEKIKQEDQELKVDVNSKLMWVSPHVSEENAETLKSTLSLYLKHYADVVVDRIFGRENNLVEVYNSWGEWS